LDKIPHLAFRVTEPCKRAQILNVGKEHRWPLDGLRTVDVGCAVGCFCAVERDLFVSAVAEWFVSRLTAAAESILLRRWKSLSLPVVQGFAFVIRYDPLFAERHTTAYEVRAILCHFDLRAVVFFIFHRQFLVRYSVSDCEALTNMKRALQFVDHRNRKIFNRNPAVAGRVD